MRAKEGFVLRRMGRNKVLIGEGVNQVHFDKLIDFNASAAYLWEEIQGKDFGVETLVALMLEKYDVEEARAREEAVNLVGVWRELGLVEE